MLRHAKIARWSLVVITVLALVAGFWIPPRDYAGSWLSMLPPPVADIVGSLFAMGVLPAALTYLCLPFVSRGIASALSLGLIIALATTLLAPLAAFLRASVEYAHPTSTLLQHGLAVAIASLIALVILGLLPIFARSIFTNKGE